MRLEVAASYHQEALAGQGAAASTCTKYAHIEAEYIRFVSADLGRAATVADLTLARARAFLSHAATQVVRRRFGGTTRRGPATLYLYGRMLKTWSRLIARERPAWLPRGDPLAELKLKRVESPKIETFSREQFDRLLLAAAETEHPQRNRALLLFLIETGCRLSEMLDLTLPNLELATRDHPGRARILKPKNKRARYVYLGRMASRALELYLDGERAALGCDRPQVFLNERRRPLSDDSVQWLLKRLGERAGITGMRCSPHSVRHSMATWYLRDNPDQLEQLRQLLGHADLKMVLLYAKLVQADVAARYSSLMDRRNGRDR